MPLCWPIVYVVWEYTTVLESFKILSLINPKFISQDKFKKISVYILIVNKCFDNSEKNNPTNK